MEKKTGCKHHAGANALLTMECFVEIVHRSKMEEVIARKGLISGMDELQMSIRCGHPVNASNVYVVDVNQNNFEQESMYISQVVQSNFDTIGIKVCRPPPPPPPTHNIINDVPVVK